MLSASIQFNASIAIANQSQHKLLLLADSLVDDDSRYALVVFMYGLFLAEPAHKPFIMDTLKELLTWDSYRQLTNRILTEQFYKDTE